MRNLLFALLLSTTSLALAQPVSYDLMSALKNDDVAAVSESVTNENIDTCYAVGESSYTVLALAIKMGAKQSFNMLLDKEADLKKACVSKTPLMYAVKYGQLEMVKALTNAGLEHTDENSHGRTAMDYAKKYKQKDIYKYFKTLE